MGYTEFYNFLIPLYGLSLGMSAGAIGMLVGARSLLAVFLSIHVGVLMDRFGTRRVTLFFVWTAMALAPVFPLLPWFWPLLLLQIVNGGALQFAWSGSQTLIAQLSEGEAEYLGRFSFFARIGTTVAPMIAGVAWDLGGAWPLLCTRLCRGCSANSCISTCLFGTEPEPQRYRRNGRRERLEKIPPPISTPTATTPTSAAPSSNTSPARARIPIRSTKRAMPNGPSRVI
jgi:MFS family permease